MEKEIQAMIIAIDGPAASGKGTLARELAKHFKFAFMDTGALYRAVAHEVLKNGLSPKDKKDAIRAAQNLAQHIREQGPDEVLGDPALREDRIGVAASHVAAIEEVRAALLDIQRSFASSPPRGFKGAVLDGRDIGTVICPDADIKLFITAEIGIRAQRRLKELQSKGLSATYDTVLSDMRERDKRDVHTLAAHRAEGYKTNILDTSELTPAQALESALRIIEVQKGSAIANAH